MRERAPLFMNGCGDILVLSRGFSEITAAIRDVMFLRKHFLIPFARNKHRDVIKELSARAIARAPEQSPEKIECVQ
jgi:hypothetical protein